MSKAFQTALEVLQAEEEARLKREAEKPKVEAKAKPKTWIRKWRDKLVKKRKVLANLQGSGRLVKLRIASPDSGFHVLLRLDGETVVDDDYAELTEMLAAYEEDSTYYLHLEEKAFAESLLVAVSVSEPVTFTLLYVEVLLEG